MLFHCTTTKLIPKRHKIYSTKNSRIPTDFSEKVYTTERNKIFSYQKITIAQQVNKIVIQQRVGTSGVVKSWIFKNSVTVSFYKTKRGQNNWPIYKVGQEEKEPECYGSEVQTVEVVIMRCNSNSKHF